MIKKRVLFVVDRNLYYRHYGPFIAYLIDKGHDVHLLHNYSHPREGIKGGYFPALYSVPQFDRNIRFIGLYNTKSDLISYIDGNNIDFVFSLMSYNYYKISPQHISSCQWVVLQHWADNFQYGASEVFGCDYFLSYSKLWWNNFMGSSYFGHKDDINKQPEVHHVGHPLNFLISQLDTKNIKKKYNLPLENKVLTYLPIGPPAMYGFESFYQKLWLVYKYSSLSHNPIIKAIASVASKILFRKEHELVNERQIVDSIKQFCLKNDFTFVVKTRSKSVHSKYLLNTADYVFYDETFYPPTISELLFISDITISHFSMATFEAIAMKSYKININLEPVFGVFTSLFTSLFKKEWIKDFNTQGLGKIINGGDFIRNFADSDCNKYKFNEKNYDSFMMKYFSGSNDSEFKGKMEAIIQ